MDKRSSCRHKYSLLQINNALQKHNLTNIYLHQHANLSQLYKPQKV